MAIDFNGTTQYATFGANADLTGDLTLGGWCVLDTTSGAFFSRVNPTNKEGYLVYLSGGTFYFQASDGLVWPHINFSQAAAMTTATEYCWMITRSGTTVKLYINSSLIKTDNTVGANDISNGSEVLTLSRNSFAASNYLNGRQWDCRIYDRVLSYEEHKTIYESRGNDGIVENLIWRPNMEGDAEEIVTKIADISPSRFNATNIYGAPIYKSKAIKIG